jgi:type II secretory pathway pseudopilin PulG
MFKTNAATSNARRQEGFTIAQMIVTVAIIAVITTFGVLGVKNVRAELKLQNSARLFAIYLEKARADSRRRHAAPGDQSSVESFEPGTSNYAVTMDFGTGTVETRNFSLEPGVTFDTRGMKTAFDWRGRIPEKWVFQLNNGTRSIPVDVSGSGDITVMDEHFPDDLIPDVELSSVTGDVIPATPTPTPDESATPPTGTETPTPDPTSTETPTPTPNGNGNGGNGSDGNNGNDPHATPTPTPLPDPTPPSSGGSPTPTPTPLPPPPCVSSLSSSRLDLSQSILGLQSGTVTFTMANASGLRIVSAVQAGNGNSLIIGLSQLRIDGNGHSDITITTKHGAGNRGDFLVNISATPSCGVVQQLIVSVGN